MISETRKPKHGDHRHNSNSGSAVFQDDISKNSAVTRDTQRIWPAVLCIMPLGTGHIGFQTCSHAVTQGRLLWFEQPKSERKRLICHHCAGLQTAYVAEVASRRYLVKAAKRAWLLITRPLVERSSEHHTPDVQIGCRRHS